MSTAALALLHEPALAKVNLCLFLGPVRDDGRHRLVTLFESISLRDELTISVGGTGPDRVICPGIEGPNLVARALVGLRAAGWAPAAVQVTIDKRIPVAAGLGGGSADAAALLRRAPELAPIDEAVVGQLAARLGADVPSQLVPGVSIGRGAGELVTPVPALGEHAFVIVPQASELSTAAVYAEADRLGLAGTEPELAAAERVLVLAVSAPGGFPEALIENQLAPAAISLCPAISRALQATRATGAQWAIVCGSGPTVAGIFRGPGSETRAGAAAASLARDFPRARPAVPVHRGAVPARPPRRSQFSMRA